MKYIIIYTYVCMHVCSVTTTQQFIPDILILIYSDHGPREVLNWNSFVNSSLLFHYPQRTMQFFSCPDIKQPPLEARFSRTQRRSNEIRILARFHERVADRRTLSRNRTHSMWGGDSLKADLATRLQRFDGQWKNKYADHPFSLRLPLHAVKYRVKRAFLFHLFPEMSESLRSTKCFSVISY